MSQNLLKILHFILIFQFPQQDSLSDTDKLELIPGLCKTSESQWEDFTLWYRENQSTT